MNMMQQAPRTYSMSHQEKFSARQEKIAPSELLPPRPCREFSCPLDDKPLPEANTGVSCNQGRKDGRDGITVALDADGIAS